MKFPVYHVLGCGEIAFSFLQEPHEGMLMDPSLVEYPDGTQPPLDHETKALCGSCLQDLEITDLTMRAPNPR